MKRDYDSLKIDKGVPLPSRGKAGASLSAALRQLQIGDSFVWEKVKARDGSAFQAATRIGIRIATRSVSEAEVRIWRTA